MRQRIKKAQDLSASGFRKVEDLLASVKLQLPDDVFETSTAKALGTILLSLICVGTSWTLLNYLPWFLLPIGWILAGTAAGGLYTIAHDCGNKAFFSSTVVNDIVGTIFFLPLLYPLESWKKHNNDVAESEKSTTPLANFFNPATWVADFAASVFRYFDLSQFSVQEKLKATISISLVYFFAALFFPIMVWNVGVWGLVKFWFVPWCLLHFWKHTLRVPKAQADKDDIFGFLYHIEYPRWVEVMWLDFNQRLPRSEFLNIPCYNARKALNHLRKSNFGKKLEVRQLGDVLKPGVAGKIKKAPVVQEIKEKGVVAFLKRLNWLHVPLLLGVPIIGLYGAATTPLDTKTAIWAVVYYYMTGLGITGGYHRLWAHRAYDASLPVRIALMLFGSGAVEGSIRWWCRDHRAHHRYTDTPQDPYSAQEGFWWAHMGWMMVKQKPGQIGRADISDLNKDAMIRWQHRNYLPIALMMAFVVPCTVAGYLWGDYRGGLFYAGFLRLAFVHQSTFFVNSLAHTVGDKPFADKHTPRDSFITALVTLGEGYHNFHHEFPMDYRNATKFYQYDPTKWTIRMLAFFGLTYNLHRFPENEVKKCLVQMAQKKLDEKKKDIDWGKQIDTLPEMSLEEVKRLCQEEGKQLVVVHDIVHDVKKFAGEHPGGKVIMTGVGLDATAMFNGSVYDHSNAARNLLSSMRYARLPGALATDENAARRHKDDHRAEPSSFTPSSTASSAASHHHHPPPADVEYEIDYPVDTKA